MATPSFRAVLDELRKIVVVAGEVQPDLSRRRVCELADFAAPLIPADELFAEVDNDVATIATLRDALSVEAIPGSPLRRR